MYKMKKEVRNIFKAVLIGESILALYISVSLLWGFFENQRLSSKDLLNRMVYKLKAKPLVSDKIVIVNIDEDSIRELGLKYPWSRNLYAEFVDIVKGYQPNLIFINLSFVGRSMQNPEQDSLLADKFLEAGCVLIPSFFTDDGYAMLPEPDFLKSVCGYGPVNKIQDPDGKIRNAWIIYSTYEKEIVDYAVELKIVSRYLGKSQNKIEFKRDKIMLEDLEIKIPTIDKGVIPINYTMRLSDFATVPFWKVMKGEISSELFKDKMVMLGITTPALRDVYMTPIGQLPDVAIMANVVVMFLGKDFLMRVNSAVIIIWLALIVMFLSIIIYRLSTLKSIITCFLLLSSDLLIRFLAYWNNSQVEIFSTLFLGAIVYIVISFYKYLCLTKEKNLQLEKTIDELRKTQAELVRTERLAAIGRLTAQISHEINNPLYAIQSGMQLAKDIAYNEIRHGELVKIISRTLEEIKRLSRLSQQILCIYRYRDKDIGNLDINKIIDEILSISSKQLEMNRIKIYTNLDRRLPFIIGSGDQLKQVFLNLILNASDAMLGGGILRISSCTVNNGDSRPVYIEICISDTGCGISEEDKERIFEPFFTNKGKTGNIGLGLYTSYNIIREHGGSIAVQTNKGNGTTFIIKIPWKGDRLEYLHSL